jgi:RNA polymerase sigma-70 factor (ECF subfamily)
VDHDRLDRELSRLPVDQRAVIVTHFFLGCPISEVAEILGVPLGTTKSRLARGLQSLRDAFADEPETPSRTVPVRTP